MEASTQLSNSNNLEIKVSDEGYRYYEGYRINDEKDQIYYKTWMPLDENKQLIGNIVFVHGFAEYCNRYTPIFQHFLKDGYKIYSFDQVGHGYTAKLKNTFGRGRGLLRVLKDIDATIESIEDKNLPLILYAQSWGGNCALNYLAIGKYRDKIYGGLIGSPCVKVAKESSPPAFIIPILELICKVMPWIMLKIPIDLDHLSRVQEIRDAAAKDEMMYDTYQLLQIRDLVIGGRELLKERYKKINVPHLYITHGDVDKVTEYKATKTFYGKLKAYNKIPNLKFETIEGGFHELQNDLCGDDIISRYTTWVREVCTNFDPKKLPSSALSTSKL
ncbi:alpha/beta-hydrolase [Neoconidiobolus thromboides FSU 785]|nr:alpha/beta-hydrolase [Neoconidiobolus thromboides FSU 785]